MNPSETPVYIIGGGNIGTMMALHLLNASFPITGIVQRHPEKHPYLKQLFPTISIESTITPNSLIAARLLIIAVQDDKLTKVVQSLRETGISFAEKVVIHTSGVYDSSVLFPLQRQGAWIASTHPNVAVTGSTRSSLPLKEVYIDVEGDEEACRVCSEVFTRLGAKIIRITAGQKIPMHIAAVVYSNFFVVLAEMAQSVLQQADVSPQHLWRPFLPLLTSTHDNLNKLSPADALTGPLARGDVDTIRRHLNFLRKNLPDQLEVYLKLSDYALRWVKLPPGRKKEMEELFREYYQFLSEQSSYNENESPRGEATRGE